MRPSLILPPLIIYFLSSSFGLLHSLLGVRRGREPARHEPVVAAEADPADVALALAAADARAEQAEELVVHNKVVLKKSLMG